MGLPVPQGWDVEGPGRLVRRSGGRWLAVGVALHAVAAVVLVDALTRGSQGGVGAGVVLALIGTWAVLGRERVTIDRVAGRVDRAWSLGVPFARRVVPLRELRAVAVREVVWETEGERESVWVVETRDADGRALLLAQHHDLEAARAAAGALATWIGVPVA